MFCKKKQPEPPKSGGATVTERTRLIVRAWASKKNLIVPGRDIGHISIAIESLTMPDPNIKDTRTARQIPFYVSLWPFRSVTFARENIPRDPMATMSFLKGETGKFLTNVEQDIAEEGRLPELTFCFYSLDIHKIRKKIIADHPTYWAVIPAFHGVSQCAKLAFDLLVEGGLEQLISLGCCSCTKPNPTPDSLSMDLLRAKEAELRLHSETANFAPFEMKHKAFVYDIQIVSTPGRFWNHKETKIVNRREEDVTETEYQIGKKPSVSGIKNFLGYYTPPF